MNAINDHRIRGRLFVNAGLFLLASMLLLGRSTRAQDFSGDWTAPVTLDNNEDVTYGNYSGMPLNNAARLRAESWNESILSLPEWQCKPHGGIYFMRGPGARLHIQPEFNPVTGQFMAWSLGAGGTSPSDRMMIYMDGRSELSDLAPHTWFGFSRGTLQGGMLKFTTTHLKEDTSRRLGVPSSSEAVLTQYWIRHGDILTWIYVDNDPVYLTEPMVRSMDFRLSTTQTYNAPPPAPLGGCTLVEESNRPRGSVPHYIPSENKFVEEYAKLHNLPLELTMGGAATMYPEYERQVIRQANQPKK